MSVRTSCFVVLTVVSAAVSVAGSFHPTSPAGQASATTLGRGQIGGMVTIADRSEQPVRRATVRISAPELRGSREIATDDRGRFIFDGLPAGRYQLTVNKPGFLNTAYGQKRLGGPATPIALVDGQKALALRIPLPRGAVVTGSVTDEYGQPIGEALVELLENALVNGQMTMTFVGGRSDRTDDRGTFRVFGLPPGRYFARVTHPMTSAARPTTATDVQWATQQAARATSGAGFGLAPPINQMVAFTPVYFPSAIEPSGALPIDLETGTDRSGVDVVVRLVPVVRVAGAVAMPDGRPATAATANLLADSALGETAQFFRTNVTAEGEFVFTNVKAGQYTLVVQGSSREGVAGRGRAGGPTDLWAESPVRVDGRDVTGLNLALQPGMSFSGRIELDPGPVSESLNLATTRLALLPVPRGRPPIVGGASVSGTAGPDGRFVVSGAAPGWYRLAVSVPLSGPGALPTWIIKSAVVQGQVVPDRLFEIRPGTSVDGVVITMTNKIASLSGKLIDGQGKPAPEYFVVMFPVDRSQWVDGASRSPRFGRPAVNGSFQFNLLPPGEYYVVATTDVDGPELFNAAYLEHLIPAAIKLTIAEGEKKVQDLKIGG